jgi:pimeloyl-ACP methyl ester carboxylesterase
MALNHYRAGAGEPLVLLHGIGRHWQMWEPVLPLLTARHDVIAVDLPGFWGLADAGAGNAAGARFPV